MRANKSPTGWIIAAGVAGAASAAAAAAGDCETSVDELTVTAGTARVTLTCGGAAAEVAGGAARTAELLLLNGCWCAQADSSAAAGNKQKWIAKRTGIVIGTSDPGRQRKKWLKRYPMLSRRVIIFNL
jgi:hypothetical protein